MTAWVITIPLALAVSWAGYQIISFVTDSLLESAQFRYIF